MVFLAIIVIDLSMLEGCSTHGVVTGESRVEESENERDRKQRLWKMHEGCEWVVLGISLIIFLKQGYNGYFRLGADEVVGIDSKIKKWWIWIVNPSHRWTFVQNSYHFVQIRWNDYFYYGKKRIAYLGNDYVPYFLNLSSMNWYNNFHFKIFIIT